MAAQRTTPDGEWTTIRSRKPSRRNDSSVTYYFTNFPKDCGRTVLWRAFQGLGHIIDVTIPLKLNNKGQRFGFVRFSGVSDTWALEFHLNQLWFKTYRLRANISKFKRNVIKKKQYEMNYNHNLNVDKFSIKRNGQTYADKLKTTQQPKQYVSTSVQQDSDDSQAWKGLEFQVASEDMAWLSQCLVGHLHNSCDAYLLQDKMLSEGIHSLKVYPLGGDLVLLKPIDEEDVIDLIKALAMKHRH